MKNSTSFNVTRLFAAIVLVNTSLANAQLPISVGGAAGASSMASSAASLSGLGSGASLTSGLSAATSAAMSGSMGLPSIGDTAGLPLSTNIAGALSSTANLAGNINALSTANALPEGSSPSTSNITGDFSTIANIVAATNSYTAIPQNLPGLSNDSDGTAAVGADNTAHLTGNLTSQARGVVASGLAARGAAELVTGYGVDSANSARSNSGTGENANGLSVGLTGAVQSLVSGGTETGSAVNARALIDSAANVQAVFSRAKATNEPDPSADSNDEDSGSAAQDQRSSVLDSGLKVGFDGRGGAAVVVNGSNNPQAGHSISVDYGITSGSSAAVSAEGVDFSSDTSSNAESRISMRK